MKDNLATLREALKKSSGICLNHATDQLGATEEYDLVQAIERIELLAKAVACTENTEVLWKVAPNRSGLITCRPSPLGYRVISGMLNIPEIRQHYPCHQFNPYVAAFMNQADKIQPHAPLSLNDFSNPVKFSEEMTAFAERLKAELASQAFKKKVSNFRRSANKNFLNLMSYIHELFKRHARLMVLRIDLGYLNRFTNAEPLPETVTADDVRNHRKQLFRDMKEKLFPESWVGYAWKLEYGLDKSFHYHLLVLLDGSLVREDVTICNLIGRHWQHEITEGKGIYHNCNASKDRYWHQGVGVINHYDQSYEQGLIHIAQYMTKIEYYIKMAIPALARSFGKGEIPEPAGSRVGRRRTTNNTILASFA